MDPNICICAYILHTVTDWLERSPFNAEVWVRASPDMVT